MQWYMLTPTGHFGYPQPEDTYALSTYDDTYCDRCGIGGIQIEPFRVRSEPKAKNSQFLQLNWVFDELFVRAPVEEIFKRTGIKGITFEPVVRNKDGIELESLKQLRIETIADAGLQVAALQPVTCKPDNEEGPPWHGGGKPRYRPDYPYCGRVKFHWPRTNLQFCSTAFNTASDIVKSYEWFGSGGSASRAILASDRVVSVIEEQQWRGINCIPVRVAD